MTTNTAFQSLAYLNTGGMILYTYDTSQADFNGTIEITTSAVPAPGALLLLTTSMPFALVQARRKLKAARQGR
jgi:hypothetical protein